MVGACSALPVVLHQAHAATCHCQQLDATICMTSRMKCCALATARRCPAGVHSSFTRDATHPERSALIRLGSLKPRAPRPCCSADPPLCVPVAASRLHNTVVSSLGGVCADTPALDMAALQQPPPAAADGGQPGSPQPQPAPPLLLLPKHLPACTVAASQLHDRYGLRECSPTMLLHGPLADQLEAMKSWCTRPVQLDRPGRPLNPRTWRNLLDGMTLYLGFLHKHQGLTQPMLEEYLSPSSFSQFMAFQLARSCGAVHVGRQVRSSPNCSSACTPHSAPCMPAMHCLLSSSHRPACPSTAGHS